MSLLNSSPARCGAPPLPDDANASWPGCALASAITSCTDAAGTDALTVMTSGSLASRMIGRKSFAVKMRTDAVRGDRAQQQRVAIRIGLGDAGRRDRPAGSAPIVDDDALSERVGELRSDRAGDEIGSPAGRNRHDELNGPGRIGVLGVQGGRCKDNHGGQQQAVAKTAAVDAHGGMLGNSEEPRQCGSRGVRVVPANPASPRFGIDQGLSGRVR